MTEHLVSAIIPVYNGERYVAEAIESVLVQTYHPFELIVVDDGSTDGSADIVKGFTPEVRYFFQPNAGLAAARNCGIRLAKGNYFAFLDADDLWVEDKLGYQMRTFDNQPELDMVFGYVKQFHSPELSPAVKQKIHCPAEIIPGCSAGTMLIRREAFFRVGLFETNWRIGEFMDWYLRAKEHNLKSLMRPEVLLRRRLHTANLGVRERQSRSDYLKILKTSLDRRRQINSE